MEGLFADYDTEGFFDEAHGDGGSVRAHYEALIAQMGAFPPAELERREKLRDEAFRTAGITFTVYGESEGVEVGVEGGPLGDLGAFEEFNEGASEKI